jgi:glycogen(starch) synthase
LLCLGRLAPEKGFDLALTALASLIERFPHIRLVIAGDGPARTDLEQQAAKLGLAHVVDFIGWVAPDKVPALLNTATVVVMPSWREGLPLVALEAALMARPVVATRVGGLPEVVVHGQTGLLIEKEDSDGLAKAIAFLLEHPETATQMGQAAQQRAQEVFNSEQCVNAYDALYQKLITEARLQQGG